MIATLRKSVLVYLLVLVAGGAWLTRARHASWEDTLWVAVYPINGDGSAASGRYIGALDASTFAPVAEFAAREAARHGVGLQRPIHLVLGDAVAEQPPALPARRNVIDAVLWSLRTRWWAWRVDKGADPPPADIEVYVRYFDPGAHQTLAHSTGIREAQIGVVNAFASAGYAGSNNVVIAHELLHTLGALDRYDPASNQPAFPEGYADPHADPRYPQRRAEIMAGRIPLSPYESRIPRSLGEVVVGPTTAAEIGWIPETAE